MSIHCIVTHELNPCMPEAYVVDVCTCCFNVQTSVLTAYGAYAVFAHAAGAHTWCRSNSVPLALPFMCLFVILQT